MPWVEIILNEIWGLLVNVKVCEECVRIRVASRCATLLVGRWLWCRPRWTSTTFKSTSTKRQCCTSRVDSIQSRWCVVCSSHKDDFSEQRSAFLVTESDEFFVRCCRGCFTVLGCPVLLNKLNAKWLMWYCFNPFICCLQKLRDFQFF